MASGLNLQTAGLEDIGLVSVSAEAEHSKAFLTV